MVIDDSKTIRRTLKPLLKKVLHRFIYRPLMALMHFGQNRPTNRTADIKYCPTS